MSFLVGWLVFGTVNNIDYSGLERIEQCLILYSIDIR